MSGSRRKALWRAFPGKTDGRMWTREEWRAFKRVTLRMPTAPALIDARAWLANAVLAPNRNRKAA